MGQTRSWLQLLFILLFSSGMAGLGLRAYAHPSSPQGVTQDATIIISASAFTPSDLTISAGSTVTWQNGTFNTYTLQSGSPYKILLPLVIGGTTAAQQQRTPFSRSSITDPFNTTLAPGGTFSHQFTTPGESFYYLKEDAQRVGRIVVIAAQGTATVTRTATSGAATATATATQAGNASATPTSAATATATATQAGNASATPTSVATATATATQAGNASATPTSAATATATATAIATPTPTITPTPTGNLLLTAWMLNTTNELSEYIGGGTIFVNVQSVAESNVDGADYARVGASSIPNYRHTMTDGDIATLEGRPKYSTDFPNGLKVGVGDPVDFGQDIGFNATGPKACPTNQGYGYWPFGPACPDDISRNVLFPLAPEQATTTCTAGMGTIGLWVNGTGIFNWSDGMSYKSERDWNNVAPLFEQYDMDICWGHANQDGEYHHHANPTCLSEQLNDTGTEHSPLYGFMADGYPIYGPWHADGQLAQSCWMTRDYNADPNTGGGCADGTRSCVLVNEYDITDGTTTTDVSAGPGVGATVTSLSGNSITALAGAYYEDYYYDASCAAQGGAYLDDHNGHSHDGLGYHYHVTAAPSSHGVLIGVFPYMVGPTFYGEVPNTADAVTSCNQLPPPPLFRSTGLGLVESIAQSYRDSAASR